MHLIKNALSEKTSRCSARSGGSLYLGFVMLFECRYSYFPPLKNFNETWNHLILVTNEIIKRKVRRRMTFGSTFSWGSVFTPPGPNSGRAAGPRWLPTTAGTREIMTPTNVRRRQEIHYKRSISRLKYYLAAKKGDRRWHCHYAWIARKAPSA